MNSKIIDRAPIYLVNHTSSDLIGLTIEEIDTGGNPLGAAPGDFPQPALPVLSARHGDKILRVSGYARTANWLVTAELANGDLLAYEVSAENASGLRSSWGLVPLVRRGADRYRVMRRLDESGRVVFSIHELADGKSWMDGLPDESLFGRLTIPGTHDTCAVRGGDMTVCQKLSLKEQLEAGVRFIDIRCRHIENVFTIHHGSVYQGMNFGAAVLNVCLAFLLENPSESIVMSIKKEHTTENCTRTFKDTFEWYIRDCRDRWYLGDTVPKLGDVRGKIVLFRRFSESVTEDERGETASGTVLGIDASPGLWSDNATFEINNSAKLKIQDQYVVKTVCNIPDKWGHIKALLDEAVGDGSDRWYINFTSGVSSGAYPYTVAKGSPGFKGENPHLHEYLDGKPTGKVGTILMDFPEYPDDVLISQLIALNKFSNHT
ncbi:MAG: phosphatidylinositol-specific phospholipase C [Acidobacteria bacterium]|nr:phosphatidylinositol-specific phospholipase C [Acidobacteriota bacterium]MCA1638950.1 phosphatidylinositol-specific phospholipase C [Acidobacteriota bacterium]